jgi:hypothetical protein
MLSTVGSTAFAQSIESLNDQVIKLSMAQMDESVIIDFVLGQDQSQFDTSVDALLQMRGAGVSTNVISSILTGKAPVVKEVAQNPSAEGRDAGIYYMLGGDPVIMEPSNYSGKKSGGFFRALSRAVPSRIKGIIRSEYASLKIDEAYPEFMFFFEKSGSGLSNTGQSASGGIVNYGNGVYAVNPGSGFFTQNMQGASSPNQFVLVELEVRDNERQITIGRESLFGSSDGIRSEDVRDFQFERLGPGVYRVYFEEPLLPGEYAFQYSANSSAASSGGNVFDFGVSEVALKDVTPVTQ